MFLLCEFSVLSVVRFVSGQHDVNDGQHLAGDCDDGFAGSMLTLDSHVEFSQSGVVLSGGLSALAEDPSCSLRAFPGDVACPVGFAGLVNLRR